MDWNLKFGVLQGAFFLPFIFILVLRVPVAVSQATFLNSPVINPSSGNLTYSVSTTLNCSVIGNPQPTISWSRGNQTVVTGIAVTVQTFSTYYRVDSFFTFTVEIVDNERSIKCQVTSSASTNALIATAVFSVKAIPTMTLTGPGNYIINSNGANTNIQHICRALNGFPRPNLSFYLDNTPVGSTSLSSTNTDFTLNVQNTLSWSPTLQDSGKTKTLKCEDSVSGNARTMMITVQQTPAVSIGSSYSGDYGASVTLVCTVTAAAPQVSSFTWKKSTTNPDNFNIFNPPSGRSVIQTSSTSQSLTISNLQSGDAGRYRCVGTSSIGTGESNTALLSLTGSPPTTPAPTSYPTINIIQTAYTTEAGSRVTLNCTVTDANYALIKISWQVIKNGSSTEIDMSNNQKYSGSTITNPSLTINNTLLNDAGTYVVTAENAQKSKSVSQPIILTVTGKLPLVFVKDSYSVNHGSNIELVCNVSADPVLTALKWQKKVNNVATDVDMSNSRYSGGNKDVPNLTITNADLSDGGNYTCVATNTAGTTTSQETKLSVVTAIPTVNIPDGSYNVVYGNDVTLRCVITNAIPSVTAVYWNKTVSGVTSVISMGGKYSGSSTSHPSLNISNTVLDDSAYYTCSATNLAGTGTSPARYLSVTASIPTVNIPDGSYDFVYGNDVRLPCVITNAIPSVTAVYWNKTVSGVTSVISMGGKYSGSSTSHPSLNISNVVLEDRANYKCSATNAVGTGTSSERYLNVTAYPPTVSIPQVSYSVLAGTDLKIPCAVSGTPTATNFSWTFTSASNSASQRIWNSNTKYTLTSLPNPTLTIKGPVPSDSGNYRCEAYSVAGMGTDSTQVTITGSAPVVNIQNTQYSVVTSADKNISCTISSSPPYTSAYFSFQNSNGQSLNITGSSTDYTFQTTSTGISLTVLNSNAGDAGTYQCVASNLIGSSQDSALLDVTGDKPTVIIAEATWFVEILKNVTLGCSVTARPNATSVQWNKTVNGVSTQLNIAGNTLKYSGGNLDNPPLTIINAQETDEGEYFCIAKNAVGEGSRTTFLNVTGGVPVMSIPQSSYTVTKNLNVTIPCSATSTPALQSVRWEFKQGFTGATTNITIGGQYTGGTIVSPSLNIATATENNQGSYRCVGRNAAGEGESGYANLTVTGSVPSAPSVPTGPVSVAVGNNTQVVCTSTGNPQPTIAWYFNGQIKQQGQTLSLNNVQKSDNGIYTCRATNVVGSVESTVTVNVQYAPINANTQTSYSVVAGQDVTLTCNTDANPASTYSWTNPGGVLIGTTQSIVVSTTATNGFGTYTCTATNTIGNIVIGVQVLSSSTGGSVGASTVASAGLSSGEIAAIVLALLLLIILIIVICFCCVSHGVCGVICGKKESKAAVEPVKEKEVYKEREVIIPRFHEESIKGKRQPSAVSRKDVDVNVNHYRKDNDYEIIRYENVAPTATTLGTIVSVPEERREPRPHRLPEIDYTYEEEERRRKHRRRKKKTRRRHQKKESEDVVVETVRRPSPVRYIEEEVVGEVIIETVRRSHSAGPTTGRRNIYQDDGEEVIITERSLSRSPSRRRREERYITEERIVNGDVIHNQDDMDLRAYDGVVVREPRLSRHGSGRYHVESERRRHVNRSRNYDDEDDYGPEVVQGQEYILDK